MTDDRPVPDYHLDPITDTHYAAMLYGAAVPWPDRGDLGRMRSALRNVALGLHPHCEEPSASCETATPTP